MYILAINSSYRGDRGLTQFLIDRIFTGARAEGAECETAVLARLKINRCIACEKCHTEKSYLKCVYHDKDDVSTVFDKMRKADIIIYGTPVYLFTMSGLLKIFLDRFYSTGDVYDLKVTKSGLFFHGPDVALTSKPFVPVICCDNVEDKTPENVIRYFQTFSKFTDSPQVGLIVRTGGGMTGHGNNPEKEKKFPVILDIYKACEKAGAELVTKGCITRGTQRKANKKILPPLPPVRCLKERVLGIARKEMKETMSSEG